MITYEQAVEQKRSKLMDLVSVLEQTTGSKMKAYSDIGSLIGRSPTWVRRIVGRSSSVRIDLHDALNIRALHDRLCAHLAAGNDALAASNDDLRRQIDALACARGDRPEDPAPHRELAPEAATPPRAGGPPLSAALGPDAPAPDAPGPTVLGLIPTAPR